MWVLDGSFGLQVFFLQRGGLKEFLTFATCSHRCATPVVTHLQS